jgi:hypothetical protein
MLPVTQCDQKRGQPIIDVTALGRGGIKVFVPIVLKYDEGSGGGVIKKCVTSFMESPLSI